MKFGQQYKMDEEAVTEGIWMPWGDGAEIKIARGNNPEARRLREKLTAKWNRPGFRQRKMTDDDELEVTIKVLANACVKDWRGVDLSDDEGWLGAQYNISLTNPSDEPYNPAIGIALMTEYEDFLLDVINCASDQDLFRAENQEEDLGNSSKPSGGEAGGQGSTKERGSSF
jgi:hypothetical protein